MDCKSSLNENRQGDSQYKAGKVKVTTHAIHPTICHERLSDESGNWKGEKTDIGNTTRNHAILCNQVERLKRGDGLIDPSVPSHCVRKFDENCFGHNVQNHPAAASDFVKCKPRTTAARVHFIVSCILRFRQRAFASLRVAMMVSIEHVQIPACPSFAIRFHSV